MGGRSDGREEAMGGGRKSYNNYMYPGAIGK